MKELLVLAGGFGKRLRSAVPDVPKPLAPVGGRPYLEYLIEHWIEQGVSRLTFLLHYRAEMMVEFLRQQEDKTPLATCALRAITEPEPMGTGGAVAYAVRQLKIDTPFLVANADTWLGSGIAEVTSAGAPAIAVAHVPDTARYGTVVHSDGKVLSFAEKVDSGGPGWINAGLYMLDPAVFEAWRGKPYSLERDLFPGLAAEGQLRAVALRTDFIDIGIPDDYFRFRRWIDCERKAAL